MRKSKHSFRKKWGQNFLVDPNIINKIHHTIKPASIDNIIEIGPGDGALTQVLLPDVKDMISVEVDPFLIDKLYDNKSLSSLKIIHDDILKTNINDLDIINPVRVVGNIPYNITSQIIFWLIEQLDFWEDAFIMVQKEVAQRLVAKASTKQYGRLTVVVGAYLDVEYCFSIPPTVFIPRPKVNSAFIRFTKKKIALVEDEKYVKFNNVVRMAFNQRRKMLKNSLKGWDVSENVKEKINFSRRPETLSIEEFVMLV
ncbi:16S rRNA (adenine(1518)-N(6)/adenine(1519)-N(6))-dimethyltransferase RsmA [bacterium]|jgi:16S rRNA (adenine1518-N6/adenine1519-N6)-dimethyltransferase|nr:16S rRNA (adenine(1518)-N(6)/adenine(1519)-N(6))-dimethyltransferase RsmA [bacterium]MBT4927943.1 16S rRNA (adenine(1518)-N(6)/adenine(1519)-N(6))-dimethyltransferase RsmA [bacterium]MBT5733295.1 16S rRNA (adenine(1518)-N(6)/adenine(1519)-N(6))-dimethyltransferase RsmA [bacterium]